MASRSFKPRAGKAVHDGETVTLKLHHGIQTQREVTGTIRAFEPNTQAIADLEARIAELRADNETRWEIVTGDPWHPAIGFLPENVLARIE